MINCKKAYLVSVSLFAIGMGVVSPAQAFDEVNWSWNKDVTFTENINIDVEDTFDISGLVEVEKIQVNVGDVTATSSVTGITNTPPSEGVNPGTVIIDETFFLEDSYDDSADPGIVNADSDIGTPLGLDLQLVTGSIDEGADTITAEFNVTGELDVGEFIYNEFDAVDLPSVESIATAIGNNQSIESTVATALHDAQFNGGDFVGDNSNLDFFPNVGGTGNTHTDFLEVAVVAAGLGLLEQGVVSADSTISDILNASAVSTATAIGNNVSVDLDANIDGDAYMVADLTQFNYADVMATSMASAIEVSSYNNLGVLDGPLVSSSATAIGNNASIKVTSPTITLP
tara:strand:+ start:27809 stop:28837 length:1029 start_codon:yes stop_codon:yes gene_type:complete